MGRVYFSGRLTVTPPLSAEQLAELDHARFLAQAGGWDCPWEVSADGDRIGLCDGGHFVTRQVDGLEQIIRDHLAPWGCLVSGEVRWAGGGEGGDESGVVYVDRNRVECVWDERVNRGPSWDPGLR